MSQSVLGKPKVQTSEHRNGFDMSYLRNFSSHAALLDVCLAEFCPAGTKGVINRKAFTRSSQVLYPAFNSVREYFDFFKVPMRYLLSMWNDWKLNTNDINSSALLPRNDFMLVPNQIPSNANYAPRVNLTGALFKVWNQSSTSRNYSQVRDMCNYFRLLDAFQMAYEVDGNNVVNLFKFAAYQKVYFDHFRNTAYESNDPFAYNLDWLYTDSSWSGSGKQGLLDLDDAQDKLVAKKLFTMRYANWRNDFQHNFYPGLNFVYNSNISSGGLNWSIPSSVQFAIASSTYGTQYVSGTNSGSGQTLFGVTTPTSTANVRLTVQQVRSAFALDKLLRASAYAPKHVRDQFKAQFGVDIPESKVGHESERIGSFVSSVDFGEVTQVVDTSAKGDPSNLGSVGGKGIGSADYEGDKHFYCDEDSIIIGLHYYMPTQMYDVSQDPWNEHIQREEFFNKFFENLGLRPIYFRNVFPDFAYKFISGRANQILGFTVPFLEEKIGKDLNTGIFKNEYYQLGYDEDHDNYFVTHATSPLSAFTVHINTDLLSPSVGSGAGVSYEYFKGDPRALDSIFAQAFNGQPETDQFYGLYRIKFGTVKPMGVYGQPML